MKLPVFRLVLPILLLFALAQPALSQSDPSIHWKVMRFPHFDLIFDANHQELARLYAEPLEDIVKTLHGVFSESTEKTLIVLNDRTDLTNGYATPLPSPTIVVFPVLPGPLETIYEHGDWPRELIMHEYTHILSFQPRRGVVKVLQGVFGSIITPNILLPRWWLEGIAVEMETRQSNFGRLRSLGQEAALRSYFVDNTLASLTLSEINESSIPTWPGGSRPYLFGSLMWSYMIQQKAPDLADRLLQRYGGRLPYLINSPAEDEFAKNYEHVFYDMIDDLNNRLKLQVATLQNVSPHVSRDFSNKPMETFSPSISPDGLKMVYILKDETTKRMIRILQRPSTSVEFAPEQELAKVSQRLNEEGDNLKPIPGKPEDGPPTGTISRLSWFPDSNRFLFDRVGEIDRFNERSDLWIYDLQSLKAEKLTSGSRAREGSVSPSGESVIFVKLGPGSTRIARMKLNEKEEETIYTPELLATVSFPTYLDEDQIVFTERSRFGQERMLRLDLKTKKIQPVLEKFPQPRLATKTNKGLLFVSSKNRVVNLYLASAQLDDAQVLTHSLTGISASTYDAQKNEFYVTELTSAGNRIRIVAESESLRFKKSKIPTAVPLFADRYPSNQSTLPEKPTVAELPIAEDYSAVGHLWPQYWLPGFYASATGYMVAAMTGGSDPVGLHAYALSAAYDSVSQGLNYTFAYANQVWTPLLMVSAQDLHMTIPLTSFEVRRKWQALEGRWQIPSLSVDLYSLAGWEWRSNEITNGSKSFSTGPLLGVQYFDYSQSGAMISPEGGRGIRLTATSFIHDEAKDGFNEIRLGYVQFFSKWLPPRHAIMLKAQARWVDDTVRISNYESSSAFLMSNDPLVPQNVLRGYLTGQFLAKSQMIYTFEYRFPIRKSYQGAGTGTAPLFIKQFHGAFVAEGMHLDGYAYREDLKDVTSFPFESVPKWKIFANAGLELKTDITLGYHFPMTFYVGAYWATERQYQKDSPQYGLGLLL